MKKLFLLFIFYVLPACAEVKLTLDNLAEGPHQQTVTVRGFLYQTSSGNWVLASDPGLKSCCIGAQNRVERQIFIEGNVGSPTPGRVYTLEGQFLIKPVKDSTGQLQQLYHLRNFSFR